MSFLTYVTDKSFQIEPIVHNGKSINIVFCFNNAFCKYFAVALQSLIENSNDDLFYDIIAFTSDLSDLNIKRLLKIIPANFSLRFYNIKEYITNYFQNVNLQIRCHWSIETYYRLFIPVIMRKYDRVLYTDSDIVFNENIDDMFSFDFENNEIIAAYDDVRLLYKSKIIESRINYIKNDLKIENPRCYFNAGVVLFNNKLIDTDSYIKRIWHALNLEQLPFLDQDILNFAFNNRTKLIHWKYNLTYHVKFYSYDLIKDIEKNDFEDYLNTFDNPVIIHYSAQIKPWKNPEVELADIFWHYARKSIYYEQILLSK